MKTKSKIAMYLILLAASLFVFTSKAEAGTVAKGGDCESTSECQSGLSCVPCASQGAKCIGDMCWPVSTSNKGKGEDCESASECQSGLSCVPCASQGAKCIGDMCWPTTNSSTAPSSFPPPTIRTDCTQEGPCKGKNQGNDCELNAPINGSTAGVCGTVTGSGGTTGGCFCWPKAQNQPSTASNTNTATSNTSNVYASTCASGQDSGSQTSCSHENDPTILFGQCKKEYGASQCDTMPDYLNKLQQSCNEMKPQNIDCSAITQNGFYGREAAKMADYLEKSSGGNLASDSAFPKSSVTPVLTSGGKCGTGFEEIAGVCFPSSTGLPGSDVVSIITNILSWLLGIFGFLAIIAFVISGVQYILSTGKEKAIDTAKRNMYGSMIGVAIALSGLIIIYAIDKMLRGTPSF